MTYRFFKTCYFSGQVKVGEVCSLEENKGKSMTAFFFSALLFSTKRTCGKVLAPQTLAFSSGEKKALLF